MKRITDMELKALPFGSKIKIVWHNSKHHKIDETYNGVIFGDSIGYEDGLIDKTQNIAECLYNDWCIVYLCE